MIFPFSHHDITIFPYFSSNNPYISICLQSLTIFDLQSLTIFDVLSCTAAQVLQRASLTSHRRRSFASCWKNLRRWRSNRQQNHEIYQEILQRIGGFTIKWWYNNPEMEIIAIWLVVWNHGILWLSIQFGTIIPTDFIFFRGVETTNQKMLGETSGFTFGSSRMAGPFRHKWRFTMIYPLFSSKSRFWFAGG